MKLFFKHHIGYILLFLCYAFLFALIVWLDGFHRLSVFIYAAILGLFLLIIFLVWQYFSQKHLYQMFQKKRIFGLKNDRTSDSSDLSQEVVELLNHQFDHYYREVTTMRNAREEHLTFINQWVHQMKTPIAVLKLMLEETPVERESMLEEVDKLQEGLQMALNVARMESFEQDFIIEQVSVREMILATIDDHKQNFIRHRVYPKILFKDDALIETDAKWFRFILYQIIGNSIKYAAGTGTDITFSLMRRGQALQLKITDSGSGIRKEDLPRVFRPFFTGYQGRSHKEATGMGLYMVAQLCEKLNHQVSIHSILDEGTEVTLTINEFEHIKSVDNLKNA